MNRRLSGILLLAFVIAAVASYVVYRVAGQQINGTQAAATTQILVAAHDLELGSLIKDTDLSTAEWVGALSRLGAVQNPVLPTYRERELAFVTRAEAVTAVPGATWSGVIFPSE